MLIEQIIEFELRGLGPSGRTCTSKIGYLYGRTKIFKESFRVDYYLLLKCCKRQCTSLSPNWAKSITKFNPKTQDFKRVLNLNCK